MYFIHWSLTKTSRAFNFNIKGINKVHEFDSGFNILYSALKNNFYSSLSQCILNAYRFIHI